ncbi:MAG: hypothetical protein H0X33_14140 [Taibaiella sp.]|nr:hypothetical protein [Taibaiella sp.]
MKNIILVFAIACSLSANSQTVVKGPVKIAMDKKMYSNEMEFLRYPDHYTFLYRNAEYSRIHDFKSISFEQDELKPVQQAFLQAATMKQEDHVNYGEFNISKIKVLGKNYYIVTKDDSTWRLSDGDYKDLMSAINKELSSVAKK